MQISNGVHSSRLHGVPFEHEGVGLPSRPVITIRSPFLMSRRTLKT